MNMLIIRLFILIMSVKTVHMQQDTCNCNCNCNKNEYFYEDCGHIITTSTINNPDNDTYPGQFPWQVLVRDVSGEICGGSLITHQHVLTAAHCVFGRSREQISVLVGHNDWEEAQRTAPDDFRSISEIVIFPSYAHAGGPLPFIIASDVAFLTLENSVSLSQRNFQK